MVLVAAARRAGLLCACGWLWNLILSLLLCAVHGVDYYSERKPHLWLIHISCCLGVLICECMSPFNNVLHFLRVIYFISNPKQLKWLSFRSLTHPPQCRLHCYSPCVPSYSTFPAYAQIKVYVVMKEERLMQVWMLEGLTSWQQKDTERS